jgi:hypothetical protein
MPRPTIVEQIAKAAEAGDLEKVKELSKKLASKEKTKPKAKAQPKKKQKQEPEEEYEVYEEEVDDEDEVSEANGFIAKARRSNHYEENSDSEEDGEARTRCRKVPFKIVKNRKNKWTDNVNEYKEDAELDKKLHKNGVNHGNKRDSVKKIKIKCKQCGNSKIMWPGEVKHSNWICDDCIIGSIRRD